MSQAEIQLRNLHPAEGDDAVRKTDRYEGIKALVENIKRFGLLVPLLVRPRQDDRSQYDVIDGNRRLMALCEIHEDPRRRRQLHGGGDRRRRRPGAVGEHHAPGHESHGPVRRLRPSSSPRE